MPRRNDPDRIRAAKLAGAGAGLRDVVMLADPERVAEAREAWPELWERIDRLTELA